MSNNKRKEKEEGLTRKDFLKIAGITGLTAGLIGSKSIINPDKVLAGEDTGRPIVDFAVKEVEEPPYKREPFAGSENLERYNHNINPFVNNELAQKEFGGKPWSAAMEETTMQLLQQDNPPPGFTLVDQTLANVSWTSYRTPALLSWEPIGAAMMHRWQQLGKWDGTPEQNNKVVKKAGQLFGAGQTGVTKLNKQWVYARSEGSYKDDGVPIIISDEHDKPLKTEEARYYLELHL